MTINNDTELNELCNWNENNLNPLSSINWRASLVPAAAVIPAPIAYIKVVAVKKLVVEFLVWGPVRRFAARTWLEAGRGLFRGSVIPRHACVVWLAPLLAFGCVKRRIDYCEQIRVFKAGV